MVKKKKKNLLVGLVVTPYCRERILWRYPGTLQKPNPDVLPENQTKMVERTLQTLAVFLVGKSKL